jgi:hypothetical protein
MGSAPSKDRMKMAKTRFHESQPAHEKPPPPYEEKPPAKTLESSCQPIVKQDVENKTNETDNTNRKPLKSLTSPWQTRVCGHHEWAQISFMYQVLDHKSGCKSEKEATMQKPQNFSDLVDIMKMYGSIPHWTQMPYVRCFPEFSGYPWNSRHPPLRDGKRTYCGKRDNEDQLLMELIVQASSRTGRLPLVAPDYFFAVRAQKNLTIRYFNNRKSMRNVPWQLFVQTDQMENHQDYPLFVEHLNTKVICGEWIFEPTVWDKKCFARMITELARFECRQEIVDMLASEGHHIKLPTRNQDWDEKAKDIIKLVAWKYWVEWRVEAERDVAARVKNRKSRLSCTDASY